MAVVAADNSFVVHPKTKQTFLLPFGKNQFYIPESAIVSLPKRSNKVADGKALGLALATKAPENWRGFCDPDCLMMIRGNEGTSVYTTFDVEGHPDEVRFLRHIGYAIAEKVFKEWIKEVARQIKAVHDKGEDPAKNPHGRIKPEDYNDRQRVRYDVLKWKKDVDCPTRAQLHPELNQWTPATKDGADQIKSCKIDPPSKARPKGPSEKRGGAQLKSAINKDNHNAARCDPQSNVMWAEALQLGPEGTYNIFKNKIDGKLYVTQYKYESQDKEPDEAAAAAQEEEDNEDENDI